MRSSRLLRSSTFRLALFYLLLFAGSVLILLGFLYWSTVAFMSEQVDTTIETEIIGLSEQYREHGLNGLVRAIDDRIERNPTSSSIYLFTAPDGRPLAGNLFGWPATRPDERGWLDFEVTSAASDVSALRARARVFTLTGGFRLLVGRDVGELQANQQRIEQALWWGLAITIALGLLGGFTLSRGVLSRIEQINQASRDIMSGDLSRRVPTGGSSEFDELTTNLNSMLDEIERLMEGIKQVSDNIAHDLRTPLTRLRTSLETLQAAEHHGDDATGTRSEQLDRSIADADQLLSTFNALLRISRIESGGQELEKSSTDLAALAQDAVELYEALAEDKSVTLTAQVGEARSVCDRDLMFQAICNLLDNAIKFTPKGGQVQLTQSRTPDRIVLTVADSGPGIPSAEHHRIVQRFYRSEYSRNRPGSGLGLSLVAAIVRAHGGSLTFADNDPGLIVTLTLPGQEPQTAG